MFSVNNLLLPGTLSGTEACDAKRLGTSNDLHSEFRQKALRVNKPAYEYAHKETFLLFRSAQKTKALLLNHQKDCCAHRLCSPQPSPTWLLSECCCACLCASPAWSSTSITLPAVVIPTQHWQPLAGKSACTPEHRKFSNSPIFIACDLAQWLLGMEDKDLWLISAHIFALKRFLP